MSSSCMTQIRQCTANRTRNAPESLRPTDGIRDTYTEVGNEVVAQIKCSQVQHCEDPIREDSRDGIIADVQFLEMHAGTEH
jgi:hypothetical protein